MDCDAPCEQLPKAPERVSVLCLVAQSCLALSDPVNCSPPAPLSMGILQARILEGVAMPSSRGSSRPRDRTQISRIEADSLLSEPAESIIPANSEVDFQRVPLV